MRIDAHPMRIGRCIRMANPSVDVHVLLPVARVGKTSVTALDLALEWFLA